MIFTPKLQPARLLRRYKRFLADVEMPDGRELTVHCPNTGSMKNCIAEGETCWLLHSDNPKRKYAYTWTLATTPTGHLACINTHLANRIVEEAIASHTIPELQGYEHCKPEASLKSLSSSGKGAVLKSTASKESVLKRNVLKENSSKKNALNGDLLAKSRMDFLLTDGARPDCYVEVKSVTLLDQAHPSAPQQGFFPDAVSLRGQKHLQVLAALVERGYRAVMLFCVQHTGVESVQAAAHIDPRYATLLQEAAAKGVEVIAYGSDVSPEGIWLKRSLPVVLSAGG